MGRHGSRVHATVTRVALLASVGLAGCRGGAAPSAPGPPRSAAPTAAPPVSALPSRPPTQAVPAPIVWPQPNPNRLPRIDVHMHIGPEPESLARLATLMGRWGIDGVVNLSGWHPGPPEHILEAQLEAARQSGGRIVVFANANFRLVLSTKDYGQA